MLLDSDRYAITYGPFGQDAFLQTTVATAPTLGGAWAALLSRPVDGLIRDPVTGYIHSIPMQWQLIDRQEERNLLALFSKIYPREGKTKVWATYEDHLPLSPNSPGVPRGNREETGPSIHLATFDQATGYLRLHPVFMQMQQTGLRHYSHVESLDHEYAFIARYESLRAASATQYQRGVESHYFHDAKAAAAAFLHQPLSLLNEPVNYPEDAIAYTRIVLVEREAANPLLRVAPGGRDEAYLMAHPNLGEAAKKAGLDLSSFAAYDTVLPQLRIGTFTYGPRQELIPSAALSTFRAKQPSDGLRQGSERLWQYQVKYRYPRSSDGTVPCNQWHVCHELLPAQALGRLLKIDLSKILVNDLPVEANILDTRGHYQASLQGIVRDKQKDGSLQAHFRMELEPAFVKALPLQLRQHIPESSFLHVADIAGGVEQWSVKALRMRAELFQYEQSRNLLHATAQIKEWVQQPQSVAPYIVEVIAQPVPYHYLETRPAELMHQYRFPDFDSAVKAITDLKPRWFLQPPIQQPESIEAVCKIALFNATTSQPLLTAGLAKDSVEGVGRHIIISVNEAALSSREADQLRSIHKTAIPGGQMRFSWNQPLPYPPVNSERRQTGLSADGAKPHL